MAYTLNFSDEETHRRLKAIAALEGRSIRDILLSLAIDYVQQNPVNAIRA